MTEHVQDQGGTDARSPAQGDAGLDDVMIAMDVVDTLRHDRRLVERELNEEGRRAELIERLKEVYRGQGIEVPDAVLEEGVAALREQRFTYDPPPKGLATTLARIYVRRSQWGRYLIGIVAGVGVIILAWYLFYQLPKTRAEAQLRTELTTTIPAALQSNLKQIEALSADKDLVDRAGKLTSDGLEAARSGDIDTARKTHETIGEIVGRLRQQYVVRIVSRPGELSGLWRIPDANPAARNFYLIVEAIDERGEVLPLRILNEETGKRETVGTWAIRVSGDVAESVQRDKEDDGIIQQAIVARKARGALEPIWLIETAGGAITRW